VTSRVMGDLAGDVWTVPMGTDTSRMTTSRVSGFDVTRPCSPHEHFALYGLAMRNDPRRSGNPALAERLCRERHSIPAKTRFNKARCVSAAENLPETIDSSNKRVHYGSHDQDHTAPRLDERRPHGRSLCRAGLLSGKVQHPVLLPRYQEHGHIVARFPTSFRTGSQSSRPDGVRACLACRWPVRPVHVAHSRSLTWLRTRCLPRLPRDENERDGVQQ
jgi:hypothetical protein